MQDAYQVMLAIKQDPFGGDPPILMSERIAKAVQENMSSLPFAYFFQPDTVLVPVPKSSLMLPDTLRVPQRIATALARKRGWEPGGLMSGSSHGGKKGRVEQSIRQAKT